MNAEFSFIQIVIFEVSVNYVVNHLINDYCGASVLRSSLQIIFLYVVMFIQFSIQFLLM